jgi:TP901 family phage tail tape measure protein
MAAINLDIGGNTRQLDRDIQKTVNKVYTINLKTKGDQPLGRITGQVNEFNKSLDASNARVIAFGASAGIIFGVERAFSALVQATIEVQKSLQDINVILNASQANLQKFGAELFSIARNTGQSFQEVAKAATEFSRQGLGVEETLKRTNEALILSRLSGLDAAKSVESLTAAVNSFASQAVTATEVVNKFATVDAAFAVSSADLADAIARVGSSAAQSGVSLNELIAIVTSAQQTTARGGAVIGNSFKTIFTRLQREKVVDLLESLGISGTDSSGQVKSTIQLLTDLGKVYDTLGSQQQAYVAEQVGGVFQINILKAALADLGKEYSIYSSALNVAAGATDQAIRRNEELNKTYASQINALQENARQLAAAGGERLLGPSIDRLVGGTNTLLSGFNESDGQNVGTVLGKGILDGIGQFIAGPGLALIGGVLIKLFRDLAKFATGSVQQLLGLNTAATQQRDLQASIQQILSKNPQLLELALKGEQGLNAAANSLLASLQKQTVELQKQAQVAAQISKAFVAQAGVRVSGGVPVVPTKRTGKAAGYIPNFAADDFAREELLARTLGAKNPSAQLSKGTIDGKKFIKNNREIEITNFGKNGDSAVIPTYGTGFIPNFVKTKLPENISLNDAVKRNIYSRAQLSQRFGAQAVNAKLGSAKKAPKENIFASRLIGTRLPTILTPGGGGRVASKTQKGVGPNGENVVWNFPVRRANRGPLKESIQNTFGSGNFIDQWIDQNLIGISKQIATAMGVSPANPDKFSQIKNAKGFKGAISGTLGTIFDTAVTTSLDLAAQKDGGDFDVRGGENVRKSIAKLFGENALSKGKSGQWLGDIKISSGPDAVDSMIAKTRKEWQNVFPPTAKKKTTYAGYIPNFAAIAEVMALETAMSGEKAIFDTKPFPHVRNKSQPTFGSAMADHGGKNRALKDSMMGQKKAGLLKSSGFIPNFAETPESGAASIGTVTTALVSQLGLLAITLQGARGEYKQSLEEITQANKKAGKVTNELTNKQRSNLQQQVKSGKITSADYIKRTQEGRFAPTTGQKLGAGARVGGFGLGITAPILAQTLSQAIPQDTRAGRTGAAATGALGNIGAGAATGFAVGGPIGAAVGAAASALLEIPNVVNQFTSDLPELTASTQKSKEALQKINDSGSKFLQAFENYNKLLNENADPSILAKAQTEYSKALYDLSEEQQAALVSAAKVGKTQEVYAQILQEATKKTAIEEFGDALGTVAADIADFSSSLDAVGFFGTGKSQLDISTEEGKARTEKITQTLESELTFGKTNEEIIKLSGSLKSISTETATSEAGFESYIDQLVNSGALSEKSASQLKKMGDDIAYSQGRAAASSQVLNILGDVFGLVGDKAQKAKTAAEELEAANKVEAAAKKEAVKATNEIIDSLQRNIRAAQLMADANRAVALADRQFQRGTSFADQFTRPAETVNKIVGADAPLAQTFGLREEIGRIAFKQVEGIETQRTGLVTEINQSIKDAFSEAVTETTGKATTEGAAADIQKSNQEILSPLANQQEKAFDVLQGVLNDVQFGEGGINTEALLEKISQSLDQANINDSVIESITKSVKESADKGNLEIIKLRDQSVKEFKTLAKEQTQKILIAKIGQAQNFGGASVGGAIEEFINPKESGQNVIDKVIESTKGFEQFQGKNADFRFDYMPGTDQFKYQYKEAQQARKEMAPERGRKALQLIDQLQDFTGYTPNAEGKGITAGVAGLKESIDAQIKELTNIAKTTSDPIVKEEITAALKEVNALGGTENIARLQVAQRTGALTETQFEKITGKFQSPVLEAMKQQAMALAPGEQRDALLKEIQTMSMDMLVSQDPTVNAINITNKILNQLLEVQKQAMSDATVSDGITPFDLETYKNEKDPAKRAAMKAGYGGVTPVDVTPTTKQDIDKKVTAVQKQALPQDKVGIQSQTGIYTGGYINGVRADEAIQQGLDAGGAQAQTEFEQFRAREAQRKVAADAEMQKVLAEKEAFDAPAKAEFEQFRQSRQIVDPRNEYTLEEDRIRREMTAREKMISEGSTFSSRVQNQPAVSAQQSFTQQEAAFSNNTSALTSLAGGIESLNSTLANFEANFANLNNVPGNQQAGAQPAGAQPNVTTTTTAPVSLVVNAQGSNDIATAVGEEIEKSIPTIINKVRAALGPPFNKVPPTVNKP